MSRHKRRAVRAKACERVREDVEIRRKARERNKSRARCARGRRDCGRGGEGGRRSGRNGASGEVRVNGSRRGGSKL